MRVSIFGLGYVGTVTLGCLARAGHRVIGVDVKEEKVAQVRAGASPIVEPGVEALLLQGLEAGRVDATTDVATAVQASELSFVCVGTPPGPDGSLDTSVVEAVCEQIGDALADDAGGATHSVVIRSTVMPGTWERCLARLEERSGGAPGERFTLCNNPEFLREGSAVADFLSPPLSVVGAADTAWAEPLRQLYAFVGAPVVVTEPAVAEALKLVTNAWHASKVCFANEVGRLCGQIDVDPRALMGLLVQDEELNLSAAYLRPGFAFGGSCLPKDLGALAHLARHGNTELPVLEGALRSNAIHLETAVTRILASGVRKVGLLGLSFKPDTDDLRGSPLVDLAERCIGKGLTVRIFDPAVDPSRLVGQNRQVALERLGHLSELLAPTLAELEAGAELVVVGHRDPAYVDFLRALPASKGVLDLVGLIGADETEARYEGLCW